MHYRNDFCLLTLCSFSLCPLQQAEALDRLQQELAELREGVRRQQAGVQRDLEAALAAKDAIIGQLRRDLQEMQARLDVSWVGGARRCGGCGLSGPLMDQGSSSNWMLLAAPNAVFFFVLYNP